ncbi:hypothetical protein DY000_02042818 [Brassica cretica]|uniref:STAS domain-containing protein n=1 Tax=Brassica cretica TaxID=69181 RepID=A0ABQ7BA75_BRACR|nr:hypothetical protein DY000_02042818 [Brassica cretica]
MIRSNHFIVQWIKARASKKNESLPCFHPSSYAVTPYRATLGTKLIGLIDYQAAYKLWKVDKFEFFTCMCSFFGVLLVSVPLGLAIAVSGSFSSQDLVACNPAKHCRIWKHPMDSDISVLEDTEKLIQASRIPGFLILAVESPIHFANSTCLQERIVRWTREEEGRIKEYNGTVSSIDTSGIEGVFELRRRLEK